MQWTGQQQGKWTQGYRIAVNRRAPGELRRISYSETTPAVDFTYTRVGKINTVVDAAVRDYGTDLLPTTATLGTFYGSRVMTTTYGTSVPGRVSGYKFKNFGDTVSDGPAGLMLGNGWIGAFTHLPEAGHKEGPLYWQTLPWR